MIRVWFNHWFSTAYRLIELMKQDENEEIFVIGTNLQIDSVIQKVCDEWYEEPRLSGEEYISYCLDFCKEHEINVFVPRRNMADISKSKERFVSIGVKVMVDDWKAIELLGSKSATYEHFKGYENINIPEYYTVKTADEFAQAYKTLRKNHKQVCIKFVRDEGGMSFRKITENVNEFDRLKVYQGSSISYNDVYSALSTKDEFDELMVLPYLSGLEVSVDCLRTDTGTIAIPRLKSPTRQEKVFYDLEIISMTANILNKVDLEFPCNVQFRYEGDTLYLLEVNTRMSGGLQMSCLASNVNIPNIALNKLLGNDLPWDIDDETEKIVSYIEIPEIIR